MDKGSLEWYRKWQANQNQADQNGGNSAPPMVNGSEWQASWAGFITWHKRHFGDFSQTFPAHNQRLISWQAGTNDAITRLGFSSGKTMFTTAPASATRKTRSRAQFGASSPITDSKGAAELLSVHTKTVLGLIEAGAIPAAKVGRAYVMLVKDVLAYLEKIIVAQTSERMRSPTKAQRQGRSRAGSRSASSSADSCGH